jgi:NADH-quinone oxidoreductase subunit A
MSVAVPTKGPSWIQFNVGYYLFALIFLIFDVELIFLYPWAVVVKSVGWIALNRNCDFLFHSVSGISVCT